MPPVEPVLVVLVVLVEALVLALVLALPVLPPLDVELLLLEPHAVAPSASAPEAARASMVRDLTATPCSISGRREARRARREACYLGVASV
jgi:hypothetical protein